MSKIQKTSEGISQYYHALVLKSFKNYNNPIQVGLLNDPGPSGMEVWVTTPGKKPQPPELLAEGKGNVE